MARCSLALGLLALVACGKGKDHAASIDRAARANFALGAACCDRAVYAPAEAAPAISDPDALALVAAGAVMWSAKAPLEVDLCGIRTHAKHVSLTEFNGRLTQAFVHCGGDECTGTDCTKIIAACTQQLGPAQRHTRDKERESLRFVTDASFIRIVSFGPAYCDLAFQDAREIVALEAAMSAATKK